MTWLGYLAMASVFLGSWILLVLLVDGLVRGDDAITRARRRRAGWIRWR